MAKKEYTCAICGEKGSYLSQQRAIDDGWGMVKGDNQPHWFCPKEDAKAHINYIKKMCIGINGTREKMREIRLMAINETDGVSSARVRELRERQGLIKKVECARCKCLFKERDLEVNSLEQLLCKACMDDWMGMMEDIYGKQTRKSLDKEIALWEEKHRKHNGWSYGEGE